MTAYLPSSRDAAYHLPLIVYASLRSARNEFWREYAIRLQVPISPRGFRKVEADFCSDQGETKELYFVETRLPRLCATEEQR